VTGPLVLKLGGELLESPIQRGRIAALIAVLAPTRPVVVIHGGGRAVDSELDRRGIAARKVDGLRITDQATRDVVVAVLGGSSNTDVVAACVSHGVPAVGLSGVDAGLGRAARAAAHRTAAGEIVDLGLVGDPIDVDPSLLELLLVNGYVPVIASLGLEVEPSYAGGAARGTSAAEAVPLCEVLNVNADVMACRIAAALGGADLVIAGATAGVFGEDGQSIRSLDIDAMDALISQGTATAGMIAKLSACRTALVEGVTSVRIISGLALDGTHGIDEAPGTRLRGDRLHVSASAGSDAHIGSDRE
jgi:acetylglutamate kinase